jgi:hypothetical protein
MPVEYTVDSLDTVDESIRGAYVETDGKFNFDPDKYAEVKAQGLKNKNKELLTKLKTKDDGLKRFEKFAELEDDDLAELLELREAKKNPPPPDPKQPKPSDELQAQFDKALNKEKAKFTSEKTELESRIADLDKQVKHYKLTVPLRDIAAKAGVIAEDMDLVLLDTAKRFALNDDLEIVVLDEDGDPTDITPAKFFETLYKEQRPKFYAASGAGGSGAPANTGSGTGGRAVRMADFQKLSGEQQRAFMTDVKAGKAKLID